MLKREPDGTLRPSEDRLELMQQTVRELRHLASLPSCQVAAKLLSVAAEFDLCIARIELDSGFFSKH